MLTKKSSIALIANDAGSANLLIYYFLGLKVKPSKVFMAGPALKIWQNFFEEIIVSSSIEEAINDCDIVITGTGWQTDIEHEARIIAKDQRIYSIACLDHWVNYKERFIRNHEIILPDEIWVFDDHALDIASKIFFDIKLLLQKNFYLEYIVDSAENEMEPDIPELLYLSEPTRDDWGKKIQGEFQALDFFLNNLDKLGLPAEFNFIFRLHPSENISKYREFLDEKNIEYAFDSNEKISTSLAKAEWVIGCQTYALVMACELGKKVYSSLPPAAPKLVLPYIEIRELRDLL